MADASMAGMSSFLSMPKMENEPVSEQTIAEEAVTDSISTVEEVPAIEKAPEATPEYTICLASQTTRYHAEIFVKKMEKSGISDVRIVKMNNMDKVRVVCGSFNTDEEAHERLHQYRASHDEFSDAWVLHVND